MADSTNNWHKYSTYDVKNSMWPDKVPKNFRITTECEVCGLLMTKFLAGEVWDVCDDCIRKYTYNEIQILRELNAHF